MRCQMSSDTVAGQEKRGAGWRSVAHDVVEAAGLTAFSFGGDDECRSVTIFKKQFAPSDEELDFCRRGGERDPGRQRGNRR